MSLLTTGLIFLSFNIVLIAYSAIHNESGLFDGIGCDVGGLSSQLCGLMELYCLAALALERYFTIVKERPLAKKQVVYMIAFGWITNIFLSTCPYWVPAAHYSLRPTKIYCLYNYETRDASSVALAAILIIPGTICINIVVHCYLEIYKKYKTLKKNQNNMSTLASQKATADGKSDDSEFQILVTVFILISWTLVGWSPMIYMIVYETISGKLAYDLNVELVFSTIVYVCIAADSIILMVLDRRWNTATRDFLAKFKCF